jgi:hypothetical protein
MQDFKTHRDVMDLWPSSGALARDVTESTTVRPVSRQAARQWWRVNAIPPVHYDSVVAAAKHRGFDGVTYAVLARMARMAREGRS